MSYKQVRDILQYAGKLRDHAQTLIDGHRGEGNDELLDQLAKRVLVHDKAVSSVVQQYAKEANEGVLDTWVQFEGLREIEKELADAKPENVDPQGSVGEAVRKLMEVDARLVELYKLAASQVNAPSVKAMFEHLSELEDQSLRDKGWAAVTYGDLRRE